MQQVDAVMQEETAAAVAVAPADAQQKSTSVVPAGKRMMQHQVPSTKRECAQGAAAQLYIAECCVQHMACPDVNPPVATDTHNTFARCDTPSSCMVAGAKVDAAAATKGAAGHAAASAAVDLAAALPKVLQQLQVRLG
jgi:hypothetical protein